MTSHSVPRGPRRRRPGALALASTFAFAALAVLTLMLAPLAAPAAAQDFNLSCQGGSRLSDAEMARGATVVVVWASWSPRSHDIAERVSALASRWGSRARVVTVNFQEDQATVDRFLAGKKLGAPVCMDPEGSFCRKFNVAALPGLLVIKDGQVVHHGKLADDADQVLAGVLH
jgi:thiol-disulfide isomerase/thioredoxin